MDSQNKIIKAAVVSWIVFVIILSAFFLANWVDDYRAETIWHVTCYSGGVLIYDGRVNANRQDVETGRWIDLPDDCIRVLEQP